MLNTLLRSDLVKLKQKLRRVRIASWSAIEQGDCRAVACLTCEASRLLDAIHVCERQSA